MEVRRSPQLKKDLICKWTFVTLCFVYTMNLSSWPGLIWWCLAFLVLFSMSKEMKKSKDVLLHLS